MVRYKLKLTSLKFISAVDTPAQETATAVLMKRAGGGSNVTATARVTKLSDELGLVFGWALTSKSGGVDYHDLHGDNIVEEDLIRVAAEYLADGAVTDAMHDEQSDGRVVFAMPLTAEVAKAFGIETETTGLMIAMKPSAATFAKFKSGEFTGFSIAGMGERETIAEKRIAEKRAATVFAKRSAITTAMEGHTHLVTGVDDVQSGCTSSERSERSVMGDGHAHGDACYSYHSHPWVRLDDGSIVLGEAAGHTHSIAQLAAIAASKGAPNSPPAITPLTVTPQPETPMITEHDKTIADLTAKLAKSECLATLTDTQRAHYTSLGAEGEAYLAKSFVDRQLVVVDLEKANEVVYTAKSGETFRKSDDPRLVAMAKRHDEQAVEIAKRDEAIEKAELVTLAKSTIGNIAGTDDVHLFIVKSIKKSGGTAEQIDAALTSLRSANAFARSAGTSAGAGGNEDPSTAVTKSAAFAELEKGLTSFAKSNNIAAVWTEGLAAYVATPDGAVKKSAYDAFAAK